jgi:hypothetical protein
MPGRIWDAGKGAARFSAGVDAEFCESVVWNSSAARRDMFVERRSQEAKPRRGNMFVLHGAPTGAWSNFGPSYKQAAPTALGRWTSADAVFCPFYASISNSKDIRNRLRYPR